MGRAVTDLSTHTFELDLTSVCVSSGTIQLPLKMQSYFEPGSLRAEIDGQAVDLVFAPPRRLSGLREHFAERGLRSNDRVRFSLEVDGDRVVALEATCIRRERPKPADAPPQREQGRAEPQEASEATSTWHVSDGVRAVKRVRIAGLPAAPAPEGRAKEALAAGGAQEGTSRPSAEGGWSSQDAEVFDDGLTTVRAVRRRSAPAARQESGPRAVPTQIEASGQPVAASDPNDEVVRPLGLAVRGGGYGDVQLGDLIAPPVEGSHREREVDNRRARSWPLPPRLLFGGRSASRPPHTSGPTRARSGGDDARTEEIAADIRAVQEAEAVLSSGPRRDEAVPRPVPARRWTDQQPESGRARVGERELVDVGSPANTAPRAAEPGNAPRPDEERTLHPSPVRASAQPGAAMRPLQRPMASPDGPGFAVPHRTWSEGEQPRAPVPGPTPASRGSRSGPSASSEPVAPRTGSPEPRQQVQLPSAAPTSQGALIDDDDFGGEYLPSPQRPAGRSSSGAGSLENDIAMLEAYLVRPGTPAIVRADTLGQLLDIGEERAERALERLSERPDRVNRIRRGAYMVRRQGQ